METGEELVRAAADHLEKALSTEDPSERNYHIRNALQCCDPVTADTVEKQGETAG